MGVLRARSEGPAGRTGRRGAPATIWARTSKSASAKRMAPMPQSGLRRGERSGAQPICITAATGAAALRVVWVMAQIDQAARPEQESSTSPRT